MDEKERTHQPLADLAGGQYGVVSTSQLQALGYSRDAISYASRSGRLHRLHQGVYAVGHTSLAWESHCLAAVLACAPDAVASHATAAWLWGLLRSRPEAFHVTAPTRRHKRNRIRLHFAPLVEEDRAVRDDIPVTSVPRTLLDYAASATPPRLAGALERAEERHLLDVGPIDRLMRRVPGHRGVARLRRALEIYRPEPAVTRSGLERRFLDLLRGSGLPNPSMNFHEAGYELDAYWRPERFAVELDVYETHGSRAAFEADREREEELLLRGIGSMRVTGPRLRREPREILRRLEAHLERRRRQVAAGVP